jgi:hypothetical protein
MDPDFRQGDEVLKNGWFFLLTPMGLDPETRFLDRCPR